MFFWPLLRIKMRLNICLTYLDCAFRAGLRKVYQTGVNKNPVANFLWEEIQLIWLYIVNNLFGLRGWPS